MDDVLNPNNASIVNNNDNSTRLSCIAEQDCTAANTKAEVFGSQTGRWGKWTPDGTSIIQTHPNGKIETIIVPQNLLEPGTHHTLKAHATFTSWEPIYSSAIFPHFALSDPSTTLVLSATRNLPIQLRNALDYNYGIYASYPWQDPHTEAFIAPHSLLFLPYGSRFIAGGTAKFAVYDVQRPSDRALQIRSTSASKKASRRYGRDPMVNFTESSSIIKGMDLSCENVLALGTTTGHVALYADHGVGDAITSFRVANHDGDSSRTNETAASRRGITQVKWSSCGRYLFIAERMSDNIEVYDIRGHMTRLGYMSGRRANAKFGMEFDLFPTVGGLEVWAGGVDGYVRCWRDPEKNEGEVKPVEEWKVHDDPVCSTLLHSTGSVIATLATQDRYARRRGSDSTRSSTSSDSSSSASSSSASSSVKPSKSSSSKEIEDENTDSASSASTRSYGTASGSDDDEDDDDEEEEEDDDGQSPQWYQVSKQRGKADCLLKLWSVT